MPRGKKNNGNRRSVFFSLGVLPAAALLVSSVVVFRALKYYVTSSGYFRIREVRMEGWHDGGYADLLRDEIVGVNTFRLDLKALSERIRRRFPKFYSVTVTRVLPSVLVMTAKERTPAAVLRRDAFYLLDTEGVVVSSFSSEGLFDLPKITGLESRLPKVRVGDAYNVAGLSSALRLAEALGVHRPQLEAAFPASMRLHPTRIDASDPANLSFYMGENLEIKMGGGDFDSRLRVLPAILASIAAEASGVRYIDLRPREPVIAGKDKEKR